MVRFFLLLITLVLITSCDTFFKKDNTYEQEIIDFTTVDTSPSFEACKELFDVDKTSCFRSTIQRILTKSLQEYSLTSEVQLDETVMLTLLINTQGNIKVTAIEKRKELDIRVPDLTTAIENSVANLPVIFPATKRGIPVQVQYKLPITLKTKE